MFIDSLKSISLFCTFWQFCEMVEFLCWFTPKRSSILCGDTNPFGVASGWASDINICQIKHVAPPAVVWIREQLKVALNKSNICSFSQGLNIDKFNAFWDFALYKTAVCNGSYISHFWFSDFHPCFRDSGHSKHFLRSSFFLETQQTVCIFIFSHTVISFFPTRANYLAEDLEAWSCL